MIEIKNYKGDVLLRVETETLNYADLRGANLSGSYLIGADLIGADLIGADLRCADLRGANLSGSYLIGADLIGADLSDADLRCANLRDANLSGADLRCADLSGADLSDADLRCANLRDANLSGAVLIGEKLKTSPVFISGLTWEIVITNNYMTIGCQRHSHENWTAFDDSTISKMEKRALEFWKKHKVILLALCAEMASK